MKFNCHFFIFDIELPSLLFHCAFRLSGFIKLHLDYLQLIFLLFFILFLLIHPLLLFFFLQQKIWVVFLYLFLLVQPLFDFGLYFSQLILIRLYTDLKDLFFLLKFFISDCIFMHFCYLPFSVWVILFHHHVQAFHFCLQFLYFLFWKFFMLLGKLQIFIGFGHFSLQIRNCMGIIVRISQSWLQPGCTRNNVFWKLSALAE